MANQNETQLRFIYGAGTLDNLDFNANSVVVIVTEATAVLDISAAANAAEGCSIIEVQLLITDTELTINVASGTINGQPSLVINPGNIGGITRVYITKDTTAGTEYLATALLGA